MLSSPKYSSTRGKCLQFWYHMYGSHIGSLNISVKSMVLGKPTYFLTWSRSGDHGNSWWIAQVHSGKSLKMRNENIIINNKKTTELII